MGKTAGTISAIALLVAATVIWSKATLATRATGSFGAYGIGSTAGDEDGPLSFADRFPTPAEMFRSVDFIQAADHFGGSTIVAGKADRQATIAECGRENWLYFATECAVATAPKPEPAVERPARIERPVASERAPERPVTIERRIGDSTSELVRTPVAPKVATASCRQSLATATAGLEQTLARVNGTSKGHGAAQCAAYRRDFFELVKAREVTALCKTGTGRDHDLGRIDLAVENINGAIAQSCGS